MMKRLLPLLAVCCLASFAFGAPGDYRPDRTAPSLTPLDRQILGMPYFLSAPGMAGKPAASDGSAAADAARANAGRTAAQAQAARREMARAESIMTSRTADAAQRSQARIAYDSAKAKAESARRTQEEQQREASKQAMYEEQDAQRCRDALGGIEKELEALGQANRRARQSFAAGEYPAAMTAIEESKKARAAANGLHRQALGCKGLTGQRLKLKKVGDLLLEAQVWRHTAGEATAGDKILNLYLQSLTDPERGDAAAFIWDLYGESKRLLRERFRGRFILTHKLRLPVAGVEIGKTIGDREMEQLEFDLFQGFKRGLTLPARFDYAQRFAARDAAAGNESFYKDALERLEHPTRATRASSVFTDDQLFYYVVCYYDFTGREKEIPNIYRAYENFVDAQKEPTMYRTQADYRETKSRLDGIMASKNLILPVATPLQWGIDKEKAKKLEEKKRLEALKKQPGMQF
ncbi:MAG: hypothetical protein KBG09_00455 [Syntrophobacterales bacterium]|nr:hypothetical protein [Syntrophobacterales bacterium]